MKNPFYPLATREFRLMNWFRLGNERWIGSSSQRKILRLRCATPRRSACEAAGSFGPTTRVRPSRTSRGRRDLTARVDDLRAIRIFRGEAEPVRRVGGEIIGDVARPDGRQGLDRGEVHAVRRAFNAILLADADRRVVERERDLGLPERG